MDESKERSLDLEAVERVERLILTATISGQAAISAATTLTFLVDLKNKLNELIESEKVTDEKA